VNERPIDRSLTAVLPLSHAELNELSSRATAMLGEGTVHASHADIYVGALSQRTPTLRWVNSRARHELVAYAAQQDARQPQATLDRRGSNAASRTWLRGTVATYLALQDMLARGWPRR
jgi:hypothetical protein